MGNLARLVEETKAGDVKDGVFSFQFLVQNPEQVGEYSKVLTQLYERATIDALRGYIGIPPDLKPFPQERLAAYTYRVLKSAIKAQDWHLAFRVAQLRLQLGPEIGNIQAENVDFQGIRSMITAMNREDASLWAEAVSGYIDALNSTSQILPTKEIGARLMRIKAAHPEDYAKGEATPDYPSLMMKLFEAKTDPPVQRPRPVFPGMPRSGPTGGFPQGGFPAGAPQPGQQASTPASAN